MNDRDQLLRFHFQNSHARGEIVRVQKTLDNVLDKHDYPLPVQSLLAEMVVAACLLSATIKFDGLLTIQARGSGPITTLMVESSNTQEVRAIAQWDKDYWPHETSLAATDLRELLGKATLAITISPTKGKKYQGIVPLADAQLAHCLEAYFLQSEQIKTRIWLATELTDGFDNDMSSSTGLLLQHLPGDQVAIENGQDWEHLCHLTNTLKNEELLKLDFKKILHRLYHQDSVKLHESAPIRFQCSCSRDRTAQALASLGINELKAVIEKQEEISIRCQFCNENYIYDPTDIGILLRQSSVDIPED